MEKIKLPLQENQYTISRGYTISFVNELCYPSGFGLSYIIPLQFLYKKKHHYKPYGRKKRPNNR